MSIEVKRDIKNKKFVLEENGNEIGKMLYYKEYGVLTLNHTRVDSEYEGQNLGHLLVDYAVNYAKENGLKVNAVCGFARKVLEENKDRYGEDVLAEPIDEFEKFDL